MERLTLGPTSLERGEGERNRVRRRFVGAPAAEEKSLGKARGIGLKRALRRTCLYPWHDERWPKLLTINLASGCGGRVLPERKKARGRGGSRGSTASGRHQRGSRDAPRWLVWLQEVGDEVAELRVSPASSGRAWRPEACPAGLRLCFVCVEVGWCYGLL